jgi:hypothetical protein
MENIVVRNSAGISLCWLSGVNKILFVKKIEVGPVFAPFISIQNSNQLDKIKKKVILCMTFNAGEQL